MNFVILFLIGRKRLSCTKTGKSLSLDVFEGLNIRWAFHPVKNIKITPLVLSEITIYEGGAKSVIAFFKDFL